jgi:LuxR family transcriptional regulator, maltose regulon positive regulatory protein
MAKGRAGSILEIDGRSVLPFDYLRAKTLVPAVRPGSVSRTPLVNRLRAARTFPLVTMIAPPGSGKTTVLAQWADRDERPFAWVSVDARDNDPLVLLQHIAAAFHRIEPLDPSISKALRPRTESIWTTAVPKLTAALASADTPFVVVLDDASRLSSPTSLELVSTLGRHIPEHSTLVLAGRVPLRLPIASIRATGRLFEVGPELLALSRREAESLVQATDVELCDEELTALLHRTEGWAAALFLCVLAMRDSGSRDVEVTGDDPYLAAYFRSECLSEITPQLWTFLRRTSILETLSGPICDAVLERDSSGRALADIDRARLFLVPLDRTRRAFRHQRLLRELLRRELEEHEPDRVASLHRLAADWFEANDLPDEAIVHAAAVGDMDRVARLVCACALPACGAGRIAEVEAWLRLFSDLQLERYPAVAVLGAWLHARRARTEEARRLLALAERCSAEAPPPDGSTLGSWVSIVRAALCERGVEQMLEDAEAGLRELHNDSYWIPAALLLEGTALALSGDCSRADEVLGEAAESGRRLREADLCAAALVERALAAEERGDLAAADRLVQEAGSTMTLAGDDCLDAGVLHQAVLARALLRSSRWPEARDQIVSARRLADSTSGGFPWLAVQGRLELGRTLMALRDAGGAREQLVKAHEILRSQPTLEGLLDRARRIQSELEALQDIRLQPTPGLTRAELRLIPLLASHLSFREIGDRFSITRNTVKSQVISIYRKLGVSSRSEAIDKATALGLIEDSARALRAAAG